MISKIITNEKGQVIEEIVTHDNGKLFSRETTKYNRRGNVSKTLHHYGMKGLDKDRIIHYYKYKYSKK
jgi:hypothetical protein